MIHSVVTTTPSTMHQPPMRTAASEAATTSADRILILPTQEAFVDQLQALEFAVYDRGGPNDTQGCMTADHFRNHLRVFPEGQFMALDSESGQVVGFTASMRFDFDPAKPLLKSWAETTADG